MNETLYDTLYKLNSNGSTQVWEIHISENNDSYWTVSGKLDGKMTVSAPTMVTPKQKRTQEEQVTSVCDSKINKKRDKKYVSDVADIHSASDNLVGYEAMLAHKYDEQKSKINFPCIVQPKLDGIRNLSTIDGFFSRGRKEFTSCTHIREELEGFYKADPSARLDGEFYAHEFKADFEKICKAVKKSAAKASPSDLALQQRVKYYVYDAPRIAGFVETDGFKVRNEELARKLKGLNHIVVVPSIVVTSETDLLTLKEQWIADGYEGIMVRNMNSPYEDKRSYNLQKLKDFIDKEFIIVGINEGEGALAGHAGSFKFALYDNDADAFIAGLSGDKQHFNAKLVGSRERLKHYFDNPQEALGKKGTVRYQNLSKDNIPRFPVCQSIRDYE